MLRAIWVRVTNNQRATYFAVLEVPNETTLHKYLIVYSLGDALISFSHMTLHGKMLQPPS